MLRQSIAMAVSGRSAVTGRPPKWLVAASDFRFYGIEGDTDTILHFEAPTLGEAAEELYRQQEFWPTRPKPEATGFDIARDMLRDVSAGNENSDRFDLQILNRLVRFEGVLDKTFQALVLEEPTAARASVVLDRSMLDTVHRLKHETPKPRTVRVAGKLDMIRASTRSFALHLDDGQEVRGVLLEGEMEELASLFGQRALVHGKAVYRPSGTVLRIDADEIRSGANEPGFWSQIPGPLDRALQPREFRTARGKQGVSAFFDTWPGDESDAELLAALKALD
jgi:hypothetical protein